MPFLILDTSSEASLLGLVEGNEILDEMVYPHANQLSATLIPSIEELLKRNDLRLSHIDQVIVGMGPGSYTGTRVGVAVAKSLSFGLNVPFRGFCSLMAFLPPEEGAFALILPSKLKQFYLLLGEQRAQNSTVTISALLSREELITCVNGANIYCNAPELLPLELQEWVIGPLKPNFTALARALATDAPTLDEKSELIYLHTVL